VIVSAGYDAHWLNGAYVNGIHERMTVTGLVALARRLQDIANTHCPGRLVGVLEGGYDLESLSEGVCGTLQAWIGDAEETVTDTPGPPPGHLPDPDLSVLFDRIRGLHGL
jgi:acetoin utilization deacetylase AcuC-like enzyme